MIQLTGNRSVTPMTDIKLTPARLDVLKAVADGEVKHRRNWGRDSDEDIWRPANGEWKKVNAAVKFLSKAGLIMLGPATHASMYAPKLWQLTKTGEQRLANEEAA